MGLQYSQDIHSCDVQQDQVNKAGHSQDMRLLFEDLTAPHTATYIQTQPVINHLHTLETIFT